MQTCLERARKGIALHYSTVQYSLVHSTTFHDLTLWYIPLHRITLHGNCIVQTSGAFKRTGKTGREEVQVLQLG